MLHPVTGDKNSVVNAVNNALAAFQENNPVVQEKLREAFPDPQERVQARAQIVENLTAASDNASGEATDPTWFASRDPMAGLAQSAMNVRAQADRQAAPAAVAGGAAPALARADVEQFGPTDPGWIECVIDGFKTLLHGKAAFVQHQNLSDFLRPIPDQITIALVGDWGAHNDAAQRVAQQIKDNNPDIIIHLGDIYYAGQNNEAEEFLKTWPKADASGVIPPGTSFALNGNHEMFSGGHAYFGAVLKAFGQRASYFGLRNNFWQILAFDSAYVEHRLLPPHDATGKNAALLSQWNWLVDKMKNSSLPTILLSHHEPLSSFAQENSDGQKLRSDFQGFLTAAGRPIFGWFFGHEHKCTIYELTPEFPFRTRLIGHGCIPHAAPPADQPPDPGCAPFFMMNTAKNQDGDAVSGFALLKFNGGQIDIQYINEDASLFHRETWVVPAT
jgi:hypothetical protein